MIETKLPAHFDGKRFYNYRTESSIQKKNLWDFIKWRITRKKYIEEWPKWIENNLHSSPETKIDNDTLKATFINHSTILIQISGLNILTDPVWSERVSPFSWIGPKRIRNPGIEIENLPHIDLVLISHDHYDHLDIKSLKILHKKFQPTIVAGSNINSILKKHKLECCELNWWQNIDFKNLKITFLPAKHWSGRKGFYGNNQTLWGSFAIESGEKKIYFAGDTAYASHFKTIAETFGGFDLALIPIGAYKPEWFMKASHTTPHEAVIIHQELNSKNSIAIHYGTFRLSDESYDDPINDLKKSIEDLKPLYPFITLECGESWKID
ncbi:MAG: MBL fold metallo-hydrolase [Alphaproteobacteria bacterium]